MNSKEKKAFEKLVGLRKQGKYNESLKGLSLLYGKYSENGNLLAEIMILYILMADYEQAHKVYLKLKTIPNSRKYLAAPALMRLKFEFSSIDIPELSKIDLKTIPDWCNKYYENGYDTSTNFRISDCLIVSGTGTVNYRFEGVCTLCNHSTKVEILRMLVVRREFLCPNCLARLIISYEIIRDYFSENYNVFLSDDIHLFDNKLRDVQRSLNLDAVEGKKHSKIARYMGQDFVFFLNQFVTTRLINQHKSLGKEGA